MRLLRLQSVLFRVGALIVALPLLLNGALAELLLGDSTRLTLALRLGGNYLLVLPSYAIFAILPVLLVYLDHIWKHRLQSAKSSSDIDGLTRQARRNIRLISILFIAIPTPLVLKYILANRNWGIVAYLFMVYTPLNNIHFREEDWLIWSNAIPCICLGIYGALQLHRIPQDVRER